MGSSNSFSGLIRRRSFSRIRLMGGLNLLNGAILTDLSRSSLTAPKSRYARLGAAEGDGEKMPLVRRLE